MSVISTPETVTVIDLEFIFLGGTKLSHTLRPEDLLHDRGDHYLLTWPDVNETAEIYKANLLQLGMRRRVVSAVEETAVDKIVRELKEKESKAQGVTVKAPGRV